MKTKIARSCALKLAAAALLVTYHLQPATVLAQGSLTPPGAPAATMKTLDQVEARTAITNTASLVTISQPGSYYLTHNLTVSTGDAIDINTNGVTLDLNGFTLASTQNPATTGYGINVASGWSDITICNGHIRGGVTNNGSGVYSGSGFGYGINYSGNLPMNVLVSRVSVTGCRYYGIYLYTGDSTAVESCMVRTVGSTGIVADTIKSSTAVDCGGTAIYGGQVADSRGQSSGASDGLAATTALNCYGHSNGSGSGLTTYIAENCYGYSYYNYGLYASCTASGCYGYSYSGTGLYAFIANVCHGQTATGTALSATHNVSSW